MSSKLRDGLIRTDRDDTNRNFGREQGPIVLMVDTSKILVEKVQLLVN